MQLEKPPIPASTLHDVLLEKALAIPDQIAIETADQTFTYAETAENARRFASGLVSLGIKPGDRVGLMMPNLPEFIFAYYGTLMAGATVVLYNVLLKANELEHVASDSGTRALVVADAYRESIDQAQPNLSELTHRIVVGAAQSGDHNFSDLIANGDPDFEPLPVELDHPAFIIYTSGTTGKPKGATLTHFNVLSNMAAIIATRKTEDVERVLVVLPMFHVFGLVAVMNCSMLRGGAVYLLPRFDAAGAIDAMKSKGITSMSGTPTMFFHILNHPSTADARAGDGFFPKLQRVGSGGAPLPIEVRTAFRERFGLEMAEGYGLSESSVSLCGYWDGMTIKPGSVGQPIVGITVRIVDEKDAEVPEGEVGELIASGDNIMAGYWNNPEATANAVRDGWLHTGDLAYRDNEGFIFIVDRKKDLIIKGGYNIYPRELEEVAYEIKAVNMAAAIGVPDPAKGEEVELIVSPKAGQSLDAESISAHLSERLAKYKLPRSITIVPEIPTGPTGKILKRALRDAWPDLDKL